MELHTKRLILRSINKSDMEFLYKLERNEEVIKYEADTMLGFDEIDKKYNNIMQWEFENPARRYCFLAVKADGNIPIGKLSFKNIWIEIGEWEIGWAFHPDYWGNGYAAEAARAIAEHAFSELGVHRVVAFCNSDNIKSENVMKNIGMIKEGHLRATRFLNGKWCDELLYSILKSDLHCWSNYIGS